MRFHPTVPSYYGFDASTCSKSEDRRVQLKHRVVWLVVLLLGLIACNPAEIPGLTVRPLWKIQFKTNLQGQFAMTFQTVNVEQQ